MTSRSRPRRPAAWRALALILLACASLSGCATKGLLEWTDDEVAVAGQRFRPDDEPPRVILRIKNVPSVSDGHYLLDDSPVLAERRVVEAADGFLEARPLEILALQPHPDTGYSIHAPGMVDVDADDGNAPLGEAQAGAVSAFVEQRDDGSFRVHVVRADSERDRWVRVAVVDIGPGSQSAARPLALGAMPVTLAWDIATYPILLVASLIYFASH